MTTRRRERKRKPVSQFLEIKRAEVRSIKFHWGSSYLMAEIKEEEKTKEISDEKSDSKT